MANLLNESIRATDNYKGFLNLGATIGTPLSTAYEVVTDGTGAATPLQLSTTNVKIFGDEAFIIEANAYPYQTFYNKNNSVNLTYGAEIGAIAYAGYFNGSYSPGSQDIAQITGLYRGDGTTRKGGLWFKTQDGAGMFGNLFIDEFGNTAIGRNFTTPITKLHVLGNAVLSNTSITGYPLYSTFNIVNNGATSMAMDRFGGSSHFNLRSANGTVAAPSRSISGDYQGFLGFWSHDGTQFNRNHIFLFESLEVNPANGLVTKNRFSIGQGFSGPGNIMYFSLTEGNAVFGENSTGITPLARLHLRGDGILDTFIAVNPTGLQFVIGITGNTNYGDFLIRTLTGGGATPSKIFNTGDGIVTITNSAGTAFTRINLGGVIAGRPAIAVSGGDIIIRSADGTSGASFAIGQAGSIPASVRFQVVSTTKGSLPVPVMTAAQASAIASPATWLMVCVTDTNATFISNGYWYWNGVNWLQI